MPFWLFRALFLIKILLASSLLPSASYIDVSGLWNIPCYSASLVIYHVQKSSLCDIECQSLSPQPTRRAFPISLYPEFSLPHGQLMSFAFDYGTLSRLKRPPTVLTSVRGEGLGTMHVIIQYLFSSRTIQSCRDAVLASLRCSTLRHTACNLQCMLHFVSLAWHVSAKCVSKVVTLVKRPTSASHRVASDYQHRQSSLR